MTDTKSLKLMEVCLKIHYSLNPHLMLREGVMSHLILEKTELSDALDISREKLNATLAQVEEVYEIIDGLFKKASENRNNAELVPDSNVLDKYFEAMRKSISDNQSKLNQLQSMGARLDTPKNYKTISNISAKALENQSALQGLSKSITSYMEEMTAAFAKQDDDKSTVLSTLDPKAVNSTLKNVSAQLRSGYRGKEQSAVTAFFSKIGAKFSGALNPNPVFDEVAKVLMLLPLNSVKEASSDLSAVDAKIEKTTNAVAEATKEITDAVEAEKSDDVGPEKEVDAEAEKYNKIMQSAAENLKKQVSPSIIGNEQVKKAFDGLSTNIRNDSKVIEEDLIKELQNYIELTFETWFKEKGNITMEREKFDAFKNDNLKDISKSIISRIFESKQTFDRKIIQRIVFRYLDQKFTNKNSLNETNVSHRKNSVDSIDFKRINRLAGLEE
jgi:hypothetical protein